jgi:hypothetical protein
MASENEKFPVNTPEEGAQNIDLASFEGRFAGAQARTNEYEPLPPGRYQVCVEGVEVTRARSSGTPMLKWRLRVISPNYRGRIIWKNNLMSTESNFSWLKFDLGVCGLTLAKLSDLQANLGKLINVKLEVSLRRNGEFENVYFAKQITLADSKDLGGREEALRAF